MRACFMFIAVVALSGCGDSTLDLFVEVQTDLTPLVEFETVRVRLGDDTEAFRPSASDDFAVGVRVADFSGLVAGEHSIRVVLLDDGGATVATRDVTLSVEADLGLKIVMSRRCLGVMCSSSAEAPSTCYGGSCLPPECSEQNRRACGDPECTSDDDCMAGSTCGTARCAGGLCLTPECVDVPDSGMPDASDTGPGDTGPADTGAGDTGGCVLGAFGTPVWLDTLSSDGEDRGPTVNADGTRVWFASDRSGMGGRDIYFSERVGGTGWTAPAGVTTLNTVVGESDPSISSGEVSLYFYRSVGGGQLDIFRSDRATPADPFGIAMALGPVNSSSDEVDPDISSNGLELFFTSSRDGSSALYVATRSDLGSPLGGVTRLPLNAEAPNVSGDGLTLYFHRGGGAGLDIFRATRPAIGASFGAPELVTELNSSSDDGDPSISADGRTMFFSSNRPGGFSGRDLYVAVRTCL